MTADLPVTSGLMQLLMEVGYVAVGRGAKSEAEEIFNGIIAARPNNELPLIGLAVSKINFGDFVGAAKILSERALTVNPDSGLAKCFLGLAVKAIGGEEEAAQLMTEVAAENADPVAKEFAGAFMSIDGKLGQ